MGFDSPAFRQRNSWTGTGQESDAQAIRGLVTAMWTVLVPASASTKVEKLAIVAIFSGFGASRTGIRADHPDWPGIGFGTSGQSSAIRTRSWVSRSIVSCTSARWIRPSTSHMRRHASAARR